MVSRVVPEGKQEISIESEEESSSFEGADLVWKTHKYATENIQSSKCFCTKPDIYLSSAITDKETWEKNLKSILICTLDEKKIYVKNENLKNCIQKLNYEGLKTTTILDRIVEVLDQNENDDYQFLKDFSNCFSPNDFLERYLKLTKKQQTILNDVIGGEGQISLIQEFIQILNQLSIISASIDTVLKKKILIDEKKIKEINAGILNIEKKQIGLSFRYFLSDKMFGRKGFIFFDGKSEKLPNLTEIKKEDESDHETFYNWLFGEIKAKISDKKTADLILQCLSFNAFKWADEALRTNCENLFKIEPNIPRLKADSTAPTCFFIDINPEDDKYEISQRKNYVLKIIPGNETELDYDIGEIKVKWTVKIDSKKQIVSAKLSFEDITFFDNASFQMQMDVLDKMKGA